MISTRKKTLKKAVSSMTKLKSNQYGQLSDVSTDQNTKEGGPFLPVFISVEPRDGQNPGQLHCRLWDNNEYLFSNKSNIYFIVLFIKKLRVKTEQVGENKNATTYFSWTPDDGESFPDGAKVQYLIAGVLVDENGKAIKDPREEENHAAFVYFRCRGVKMTGAIKFLNELNERGKELEPLSDDDKFERAVVTPRRFITKVGVAVEKTNYGNKYIFSLTPDKLLPDNVVVGDPEKGTGIMNQCMQWVEPFKKQFDLTDAIKTAGKENGKKFDMPKSDATPSFDDTTEPDDPEDTVEADEVELELGLFGAE